MKKIILTICFMAANILITAESATTSVSVRYSTSYNAWSNHWGRTYHGPNYEFVDYGFHPGKTVYIRETIIRDNGAYQGRTRVEVYETEYYDAYNSRPYATYYTHKHEVIGCHGGGVHYYNSHHHSSYSHFYASYSTGFDTAAEKIITGTMVAGIGGIILAGSNTPEGKMIGAGLMISGSASKAKGYNQNKAEKTALYLALKNEEKALQDDDTDL